MRHPDRPRSREPAHDEVLRPVVDGLVACPRRGRVDVLECFLCIHSRGLSGGADERVVCTWSGLPAASGGG